MSKLKKSSTVLVVIMSLFATSAVAMAQHNDDHPEDTQFSFGYDDLNHFLAINIGANDTVYNCQFENGTLVYEIDLTGDGVIPVTSLTDSGSPKTFTARPADQVGDYTPAAPGTTVAYTGITGQCPASGVIVAGPNGQINHGQFMKAAKSLLSLYSMKGMGCVVRHLAQSDIGRTDATRVRVGDDEASSFTPTTSGEIDFKTIEADCVHGKKDRGPSASQSSTDRPRGKSADAPGRNK